MPEDAAAYALAACAVLLVAAVLTVALLLLLWACRRVLRGGRPVVERPPRGALAARAAADRRVLRRCDACGVGWKGHPFDDRGRAGLALRRRVRRARRGKKRATPRWVKPQGWSRCPSCLSTDVRTSSRQPS